MASGWASRAWNRGGAPETLVSRGGSPRRARKRAGSKRSWTMLVVPETTATPIPPMVPMAWNHGATAIPMLLPEPHRPLLGRTDLLETDRRRRRRAPDGRSAAVAGVLQDVGDHVRVGEHDALGTAGRAAGVGEMGTGDGRVEVHRRGRVGVGRRRRHPPRRWRAAATPATRCRAARPRPPHRRRRAGPATPSGGQLRAHRGERGPGEQDPVVGDRVGQHVRQMDADDLTGGDPESVQVVGERRTRPATDPVNVSVCSWWRNADPVAVPPRRPVEQRTRPAPPGRRADSGTHAPPRVTGSTPDVVTGPTLSLVAGVLRRVEEVLEDADQLVRAGEAGPRWPPSWQVDAWPAGAATP